jgi:hypothetical protein
MRVEARPERRFLAPWLASAAIVTIVRLLHAADLGYDLTIQIQAAQNVLAGHGLTAYTPRSDNLADPHSLVTLTQFPSGYSLYAAAMLALGAGPGTLVKIMGALATLVGWWGWGKLAFAYMEDGWRRDRVARWTADALAVFAPLFFTLPWQGTDIVLWATVPWVLRCLVRSPGMEPVPSVRLDIAAGALTGFCILMRYVSLFLPLYACFLMARQSWGRKALLIRRAFGFGAAMLPAIALQAYFELLPDGASASAGGGGIPTTPCQALLPVGSRLWSAVDHVPPAVYSFVFWIPGTLLDFLAQPGYRPWAVTVLIGLLLVPVLVIGSLNERKTSSPWNDARVVAAGLFAIVPLFLFAIEILSGTAYTTVPRYYLTLVPLALFVAYLLATTEGGQLPAGIATLLRWVGRFYLAGFVAMGCIGLVLLPVSSPRGKWRRSQVVGTFELRPWPSFKLTYESSPARTYVLNVLSAHPQMVFITDREAWFMADPAVDRSRLHRIVSCRALRATHLKGPAELLFLVSDRGSEREFYWTNELGGFRSADCFNRLPALSVVQRFPDEKLRVLRGFVPAGTEVNLAP